MMNWTALVRLQRQRAHAITHALDAVDAVGPADAALHQRRRAVGRLARIERMRERLGAAVEHARPLDDLLGDILDHADHVDAALLLGRGDVVRLVADMVLGREELVEVADALRVRLEKLALAGDALVLLDEVEDDDGRAVTGEEVVKVERRGREIWIGHADCARSA